MPGFLVLLMILLFEWIVNDLKINETSREIVSHLGQCGILGLAICRPKDWILLAGLGRA